MRDLANQSDVRGLANQSDVRGLDATCAAAVSGSCWPREDDGSAGGDGEERAGGKGDTGDGGSDTTIVFRGTDKGAGAAS